MNNDDKSARVAQAKVSRPDFDSHFRRHVMPEIRKRAWKWAKRIASGERTYAEAYDNLCGIANWLGALDYTDQYEIEDEVGSFLAAAIMAAEEIIG
jgi:hypothetical protein